MQKKKLKVLCLHGWNTSKEILEFQTKTFREVFSEVIDFHTIEAPHDCKDKPNKALARLGFKQPFKEWMHIGEWKYVDDPYGGPKLPVPLYKYGIEESMKLLVDEFNS